MEGYDFIEVYLRTGGSVVVPAKRTTTDTERNMLVLGNDMGRTVGEFHWEDIYGWGISCGTPIYGECEEFEEEDEEDYDE